MTIACAGKLYMLYMIWIGNQLRWVHSSPQNDWIVALAGTAATIWLLTQRRLQTWKSFFELSRFLWPLLMLLLYGYACVVNRETFTMFSLWQSLAYADVAVFVLALWWVMPLLSNMWRKTINGLQSLVIEETDEVDEKKPLFEADEADPKDELGRQEEADRLCDYIMSQGNKYDSTLAVAVRGTWGSGKTTFLTYMKKNFGSKDISYFDYSPWLCGDGEAAQHFLRHLDAHLHQQGVGVDSLQMYIRSLSISNITGWFPLTIHALRHLFTSGKDTLQGSLDAVSEAMSMLEKPIVAFIDDVDRVGKEEFLSVMKLVRMTARFPNLIYVVAYDGDVAKQILDGYGQGTMFLDKIFNVKHDLQPVSEEKMMELAKEKLKQFKDYDEKTEVFGGLTLTDYVTTIRELKHLFNTLHKDYLGLTHMRSRSYFNFPFFVKLELLKHYDFYIWQRIKDEPGTYLNTKNEWDDMMAFVVKAEMEQIGNEHTKDLLAMLFDSEFAADCEYVCPGGLQMMFPDLYDETYLSKQEVEDAIKKGRLYSEVFGWIKDGRKGIAFMLSHHLGSVSVTEMAKVCEVMIKHRPNDIIKSPIDKLLFDDTLSMATFGRIRQQNNPYNYVEKHHELYILLLHQIRNKGKKAFEEFIAYAKATACPRELMAIVYGMLMNSNEVAFGEEKWIVEATRILFFRLAAEEPKDDIENQYKVLEAMEYVPLFESQYSIAKPLLEEDLGLWLRWAIRYDDTLGGDVLLTANVDVLRTMFDTYEDYKALMDVLMDYYKDNDEQKAIIEEHRKLVERTNLISVLSMNTFYQSEYPHLKDIVYKDKSQIPVLHQNYEQTKDEMTKQEHPFYKNESRLPELEFGV